MAFKGTRRRSARAIAEEIESAGGDLNAATSTEQTAYYARVLAADTPLALDILADILTDSSFEAAELDREKQVVIQEIAAVEDTPDDLVFEMLTRTAYPDQAIGRPILGTPETVSGFTRGAIETYLGSQYGAGNMIIAAAGAVDHERFLADVSSHFGQIIATPHLQAAPARYKGGDTREKRRLEQAHITVAFKAYSFRNPRHYAAHIFSHAVGGGMSSRLFQTVREERGLAYAIHSFDWTYEDTGLFGFYAATSAAHVPDLMPVALDCLAEATENLTEAEVSRAKAQLKVSLLTALESSSARANKSHDSIWLSAESFRARRSSPKSMPSRWQTPRRSEPPCWEHLQASLRSVPYQKSRRPTASPLVWAGGTTTNCGSQPKMALFRIGLPGENVPVVRGDGITLRPAEMRDYEEWVALRERSRTFLVPWEPIWPADDLTRAAFRRRVRAHTEEIERDEAYPFFIYDDNEALVGGITIGQVSRGVAQTATLGYWMGQPYAGCGYMSRAVRAAAHYCFITLRLHRLEAACLPHNEASSRFWKVSASPEKVMRAPISGSTGSGRTTCSTPCWSTTRF